jgi:hypothetical protein
MAVRRKRNIEQGFWSNGVFHPIRSSSDYNPKRGGDMGDRSMSDYARRKRKKNPGTKAERAVKAQKASKQRRIVVALKKFLEKANPAMKTAGASVTRLKGGGFTIRPIKAVKRGRR